MTKKAQKIQIPAKEVKDLINGDITIFEKVYRALFQHLFDFAYNYLGDEQIAEDIVQDVFIYLWNKKAKLDPNINLKAYLFTAVKNKSLNYKRHLKLEQKYANLRLFFPDSVEMPDETLEKKELLMAIQHAINQLPEKRRIIFVMHRFKGYTYNQIAEIQKISVKTVETQIRRSNLFLEKKLARLIE